MTPRATVVTPDAGSLVERYAAEALEFKPRAVDSLLRAVDVVLAASALAATAPVLVLCAIAVRTSGQPVLYRGERVGRFGEKFTMYKFRTLKLDAEQRLGSRLGEELTRLTESGTDTYRSEAEAVQAR